MLIDANTYWFDTNLIYYHGYEYPVNRMKVDLDDVDFVAETSLTIRGTRRRTTVPKEIVERLSLGDGDRVRWVLFHDGHIAVAKVRGAGRK